MSVTLRLEGLSSAATSHDIREYFSGLEIPVGGVTVIGGKRGEAFVNFITWEDARRAIEKSGRPLKDSTVYVSLSSKDEMQLTLQNNKTIPHASISENNGTHKETDQDMRDSFSVRTHIYLRITLSSSEATKQDIKRYFYNLEIRNVLFLEYQRSTTVCDALVKFANRADATEGINRYRDSKLVNVTWSSLSEWIRYGGCVDHDDKHSSSTSRHETRRNSRSPRRRSRSPRRRSRSPRRLSRSSGRYSRSPRRRSRSLRRRSRSSGRRSLRRRSRSSGRRSLRRRSRSSGRRSIRKRSRSSGRRSRSPRRRSRSPRRRSRSPRRRSRSPRRLSHSAGRRSLSSETRSLPSDSDEDESTYTGELHVRVTNLSYSVGKSDLKKLFYDFISDDNITFLYDAKGDRTRECFVTFTNDEHHKKVLQLNNFKFNGRPLHVSPISTSKLRRYFTIRKSIFSYDYSKGKCLHLRNLSVDVSKSDVQKFFADLSVTEEDIFLLCDKKGNGLGEALVRFPTDKELFKAEKLNRKKMEGKEIALRYISKDKLKSFLCTNYVVVTPVSSDACVTQEDDEYETQEDGTSEDKCEAQAADKSDASPSDNDQGFLYECVTQEDDAANDDSITHTDLSPGDADVCPGDADVCPGDADVCPGDADIQHDNAELGEADVPPGDAIVPPENVDVPPLDADVQPGDSNIIGEDKCIKQEGDVPKEECVLVE